MLDLSATRDIVVLSPPGMMRASHDASSDSVRTSRNFHFLLLFPMSLDDNDDDRIEEPCRSNWMCSLKAPCRARTPTVTSFPFSVILGDRICGKRMKSDREFAAAECD